MNKKTLVGIVVGLLIIGVSFYAGKAYGQGQATNTPSTFASGTFAGRSGTGGGRAAGSATIGQLLSTSGNSATIQLASGSTQIVLMGTSTQILKTTLGSPSDLSPGTTVLVTGTANSDGSLTAQSIQIRPAGMNGYIGARSQAAQQTQQSQ